MRYSEFIRAVEDMGFRAGMSETGKYLCVERDDEFRGNVILVGVDSENVVLSHYTGFLKQTEGVRDKLFSLAVELAKTPIDEREDEKRYRLRLPYVEDHRAYLKKLDRYKNDFLMGNKYDNETVQSIFTESEIEELIHEYNLDSFDMEEVNEDE